MRLRLRLLLYVKVNQQVHDIHRLLRLLCRPSGPLQLVFEVPHALQDMNLARGGSLEPLEAARALALFLAIIFFFTLGLSLLGLGLLQLAGHSRCRADPQV